MQTQAETLEVDRTEDRLAGSDILHPALGGPHSVLHPRVGGEEASEGMGPTQGEGFVRRLQEAGLAAMLPPRHSVHRVLATCRPMETPRSC